MDQQDKRDLAVETHGPTVWRIALSRTQKEDAAEDVFQEVFLRLFEKEREFESDEHLKAWLIRTTMICCKRYMSVAFRNSTISLEEVSAILCAPEEDNILFHALLSLPEKYRLPIQLYFMEGMEAEAAAKALDLRLGTFRVRLTRGKALLKEVLKGEGIDV